MEKRVLLAVFLSFLVLYVYQALVVPPKRPATQQPASAKPAATAPELTEPAVAETTKASVASAPAESAPEALVPAGDERDIVYENGAVRAVFTNRGGTLTSWRLKKYLNTRGEPLELVPVELKGEHEHPFSLDVGDEALTKRLNAALFKPSADAITIPEDADNVSLVFEYRDASGLSARKEYVLKPKSEPYVIRFSATVENGGRALNPTVLWGPAIGSGENLESSRYYTPPRAVYFAGGKVTRVNPDKIAGQPVPESGLPFAGVEDHYFLAAEVGAGAGVKVSYAPRQIDRPKELGGPWYMVSYAVTYPAAPAGAMFFLGPKDFDILQAVNRDLVRAVDFGFFAWLVVPLLRALKWVNGFAGNYGWSIIILTMLINLVMFPLRHKSVVSMRKMQEIQPEVKAIQERYAKLKATDPAKQKMNQEMMQLYRDRGVNPASGCIPMLLTMPVLFAFYSLLSVAIELRGAPFMFWIRDLSAHDPLYVTPILMGITMVVQQRMTPTAGDPMQQKMMMIMPVVFTGMFLWAPSGLAIYFFVSNVWGIGQQVLTNRLIGPPKVRTVRPPAERRLKRAGAGKTAQAEQEDGAKEQGR
jgi:YidC/Oxa1 family membrane protein insertase